MAAQEPFGKEWFMNMLRSNRYLPYEGRSQLLASDIKMLAESFTSNTIPGKNGEPCTATWSLPEGWTADTFLGRLKAGEVRLLDSESAHFTQTQYFYCPNFPTALSKDKMLRLVIEYPRPQEKKENKESNGDSSSVENSNSNAIENVNSSSVENSNNSAVENSNSSSSATLQSSSGNSASTSPKFS